MRFRPESSLFANTEHLSNYVLAIDVSTPRGSGRLVLLTLWQAAFIVTSGVVCAWLAPGFAKAFLLGGLAVFLPCAVITVFYLFVHPFLVFLLALARTVVVAVTVMAVYLTWQPHTETFFIGAGGGVFAVAILPLVIESLRDYLTKRVTAA